jgi:CrcB protein
MEALERYGLVAAGGAIGSILRYWAAMQFGARASTTFFVNILGSFLIGILAAAPIGADLRARLLAGSGFLGGFTTFSTWQLEAVLSSHANDWRGVAVNLFGSVIAGFAAATLGYVTGTRLR